MVCSTSICVSVQLHNNIFIMCVMYKQTRNRDNETACDNEWTRQRQHTFSYCTLSPHVPLHLQSSYIRSVHVRSMQWTPLVVQSKRVSTRIRFEPPPQCRTRQVGMPCVAHVAAMLVGCSPLSENLERTTLSLPRLLHWLNTFSCT